MPTLTWIGKPAVVEHHKQVPLHLLVEEAGRGAGDPASENLLIEGDNLLALKALLPRYAGQVKCIYIDPPQLVWSHRPAAAPPRRLCGPARGLRRGLPAQRDPSAAGKCGLSAASV